MDIGKDTVNALCKTWWQKARMPLSIVIFVNLGFHNKIPENGWLKQQIVISRGSRVWGVQGSVWSANLGVWWGLPYRRLSSSCLCMTKRARELGWGVPLL